jgi:hypothetical protein
VRARRERLDPALGLPCRKTAPQIGLDAGGGLVALLGGLGGSFITIAESAIGTPATRSWGGTGCRAI